MIKGWANSRALRGAVMTAAAGQLLAGGRGRGREMVATSHEGMCGIRWGKNSGEGKEKRGI
jgi:hypothetical protein